MLYSIIEEPKYINQFLVILEGMNDDGQYFTLEELFSKQEFENKVSKDLALLLSEYYSSEDSILYNIQNESFNLEMSDLSGCEDFTGHEVLFFDEKGVCHAVCIDWYSV